MIRYFAAHPTAANLLMLLILAAGLMSLPSLRRETFPDFSVDAATVTVIYPGASTEEVEESICQRIEEAIENVVDVDEVRCDAREGVGSATIEMRTGGNAETFISEINTEIDAIDDFPEITEDPIVRQINLTDLVVSIAVNGPMAEPDLKVYAEQIKDRLTRLSVVSQVKLQGFSERQIRIEPDATALRQYGLSVADIARKVEAQSINLPSGTVETRERDVLVRFDDERRDPLAFEDLVIKGGDAGGELRLGQIARITDRFERDEDRVFLNDSRAAILQVSKTKNQDTLLVFDAVQDFVAEERRRAPPGVTFELTRDIASIVRDRLQMLLRNGAQGTFLVFLVMWLFFSFRLSFWVVMALPVSFIGSLLVMTFIGFSINMLTMVALLIAIGIIMDDSIVIAENIARLLREGHKPLEAAVKGTGQVTMGVVSSFATSVCVFAPLAFLEGDIGKVLKVVPVVLIITLSVSLIEAFMILPNHLSHSMKGAERRGFGRWFDKAFEGVRDKLLGRLVDLATEWRYLTLGLVVMVFLLSVSMVAGGLLKFRAFPDLDGDVVETRLLLPQGTPLARTQAAVSQIVEALGRVDKAFTPQQPGGEALVRNVLVQYNVNADASESGPHLATVTADLLRSESRNARVDDILNLWRRETGPIPDVVSLTYKEPQIGPGGLPIDVRLQGDDLGELKAVSTRLIEWLARYDGVADLTDDLRPGKPEIRLKLRDGAAVLGLDAQTIAAQLRAAYFGNTAAEIQVGSESFEIDVRLPARDRNSLADLDYFAVTLPDGSQVPLSAVTQSESARGFSRIARIDGLRTVTVRGDVDTNRANVNEILADTTQRLLPDLQAQYPSVIFALEGEAAEQAETGGSMQRGFLFGLLGVFLLLSFQFRSYVEPVIVMVTIPLALIGVIWGHLLMGLEISMPSILGYASLAGIVVNDSILLVTFIKMRAAEGLEVVEAARQASRDRFRPVLLTSLTTIAGLLPLLFERSLQAQVLVPLVNSLAFGLLASTVLVLLVIPALYAILHDFELSTLARREGAQNVEPSPAS